MKLAVGLPSGGAPKWQTKRDLLRNVIPAVQRLGVDNVNVFDWCGLLPMSREVVTMQALQWGADFILWMDDDQTTEANPKMGNKAPVAGLLEVMEDRPRCAIVGAVYLKQTPRMPTVTTWHPTQMTTAGRALATIVQEIPPVPFRCAAVGAGFSLARVAALRELLEDDGAPVWRTPLVVFTDGKPKQYTNEDSELCVRIQTLRQDAGKYREVWEVWADPRPITTHWKDAGPLVYEHGGWETQPRDLRPLTQKTCALFRDEFTGALALDVYTVAQTRAREGYGKDFPIEMNMGRK